MCQKQDAEPHRTGLSLLKREHVASTDLLSLPPPLHCILAWSPEPAGCFPLVLIFLLLGLVVTCAHPAFWNTVHSRLDMTALPGPSIPSLPWKATAPPQSYRDIPVRDGVTVLGVISWPLLHSLVPPQRFSKCGPWTSSIRLT